MKKDDLVIIRMDEGVLKVYAGENINLESDNLHVIDAVEITEDSIKIDARCVRDIHLYEDLKEGAGTTKFDGKELSFYEVVPMLENPKAAVKTYYRYTTLMRLLGRSIIAYNYLEGFHHYRWNAYRLKQDYWRKTSYRANVYIIKTTHK